MSDSFSGTSSYGQFIVVLLIFVGVLALTYFVTRWISGYQRSKASGSNIQLIESASISSNKYIQIVRVGNKYIAIAVSKDNVTKLTELSEEEIKIVKPGNKSAVSFKDILDRTKKFNENDGNE